MSETEFSVFAKKLATKYKKDQKVGVFTQGLFETIYLSDSSVFAEYEERTYRGYYYGQNDISDLAQRISDDLDPQNFARYIETGSDDTISFLCEEFHEFCPDIDETNYSDQIAKRFVTIINNAAAPKIKKRLPVSSESQLSLFDPAPKDQFGIVLVAEANSMCPGSACANQLYVREHGHLELCYDVVVIDTDAPDDDVNNLIAMCPSCAARYRAYHQQEIAWLKERKQQLQDSYDDHELTSSEKVQDGVKKVLQKIPKMKPPEDVDLNYDPVPLKNKIRSENIELYLRAKVHVNAYYSDVHEALQEMGREGLLRFKPFCAQVRKLYYEFAEKGYDQPRIYREMTRWLHEGTREDWDYCQIVVSYFIQKCEVFDVITE